MSVISKDKETLRKPRKSVGAKASLRDRIVKKLYAKLDEDDILNRLSSAFHTAMSNQSAHLERQQAFYQDIDGRAPASAEQPFSQTSNLHLPMPFIITKTYHARFMQALLGVDPPFSLKAQKESATDSIQMLEDLMRYALHDWANKGRGVEEALDTWIWNWAATGTGIVKTRWLAEYERIIDVELVDKPIAPRVELTADGREELVPQFEQVEEEVTKDIRCFYGPMVEYINLEDFCMVGGAGDPDLADIVFHRTYKTSSELYNLVDRGIFDAEAVTQVVKGGRDYQSDSLQGGIKQQRALNAGKGSVETEANHDRYEVIEALLKYDVDGSGVASDIVVWFSEKHALLGCTYLRRIIKSGKRPYSVIHFHKRPDQEWGIGLPEILHPLTKELDAMHNIRIDTGLLTNMPFFFYRPGSGFEPQEIQLEPGMGYPVDNPQQDVYFPTIANKTAFTAQEEQVIQSYIERLTGISDLSLGVMSGTQGATRTASGVRALLGESNSNLDVHLRRLNRGWKKILHLVYELVQTRIEPGFTFRVTGQDGKDVFYNLEGGMLPAVDFELTANSSNSNKSVQIEVAQQVMGMTMNPLNIQLGITGPAQIYEAQRNYAQALGIKDVNRFFKKPEGTTYVLQPKDEFMRVIQGQDVQVAPEADHAGFIAFATTMIDQQAEAQTLSEAQIQAAILQIRKHESMQQALDAQQAQVAVGQQMQANAAQSQQQAPAALNPMAGAAPGALPAA